MEGQEQIGKRLGDLRALAPAGYALAFHVHFTTPTFLFQTYRKDWLDYYSQNGLVMSDPTVHWGFENTGTRRWSDLVDLDTTGMLQTAAKYGLNYGVTIATESGGSRSMASFSRSDREYSDEEQQNLSRAIGELHDLTAEIKSLSPETTEALRRMSISVTHPGSA